MMEKEGSKKTPKILGWTHNISLLMGRRVENRQIKIMKDSFNKKSRRVGIIVKSVKEINVVSRLQDMSIKNKFRWHTVIEEYTGIIKPGKKEESFVHRLSGWIGCGIGGGLMAR